MPKIIFFDIFCVLRCLDLWKLLEVLIANLVLIFDFRQYAIPIFLASNLSPLTVHLNPKIISAIMLEIAFLPAAKRSKETRSISHPFRICLVVLLPVIRLFIKLLKQGTILFVFNVMLPLAIIAIACAWEITISNCCRHHFMCVIIIIKEKINFWLF